MFEQIVTYVQTHWENIILAVLGVLGAASAVARLTPTQSDDAFIQKLLDAVHALGLTKPKDQ